MALVTIHLADGHWCEIGNADRQADKTLELIRVALTEHRDAAVVLGQAGGGRPFMCTVGDIREISIRLP
jgi:hypothetical protein